MMKVSIMSTSENKNLTSYLAVAGHKQSVGNTAGEALDALTAQLSSDATGTLVIVQTQQPDEFFNSIQQQRLSELMTRWRAARDQGQMLAANEQAELDALVRAELRASAQRTAAMLKSLAQ